MTNKAESISALMDGEVDELELRRLLSQLAQTPEEAQRWQRYQLTSALLRGEAPVRVPDSFSARVMSSLGTQHADDGAEQSVATPQQVAQTTRAQPFLRSLISMGVAASVTAVLILGGGWLLDDQSSAPAAVALQEAPVMPHMQARTVGLGAAAWVDPGIRYQADVIRMPESLQRYIDQHRSMQNERPAPELTLGWIPEGYRIVRRQQTPDGDVLFFSNGESTFSIAIELLEGRELSDDVAYSGDFIAVSKVRAPYFVTVVGDMPLMVADRIAAAIEPGGY